MQNETQTSLWPTPDTKETRDLCVLVAEDDEGDAYLISRALAGNPAVGRVVRARDGAEALAMVERGEVEPDLAFIDLHMPRKDGFDLLVEFTGRPEPRFPLVVLTTSGAQSDAVRSRLRGAARVITKPDNLIQLFAVLTTAIDALCPRPPVRAVDVEAATPAWRP